jgi:hypothetical protein
MHETTNPAASATAALAAAASIGERAEAHGRYIFECFESDAPDAKLLWREVLDNVVCTEGKNLALDAALAGSSYSVTGPYIGLIASGSFTAVDVGDTGAQINGTNGWKEAGGAHDPVYSGNRKTCVWSPASAGAKALSAALAFTISSNASSALVKGAFILFGAAALNTIDDAHGTLWSAGTFATAQPVIAGNVVNVSYSTSL